LCDVAGFVGCVADLWRSDTVAGKFGSIRSFLPSCCTSSSELECGIFYLSELSILSRVGPSPARQQIADCTVRSCEINSSAAGGKRIYSIGY
jgi:hypothetical protein